MAKELPLEGQGGSGGGAEPRSGMEGAWEVGEVAIHLGSTVTCLPPNGHPSPRLLALPLITMPVPAPASLLDAGSPSTPHRPAQRVGLA